jgi:hypothetical protein
VLDARKLNIIENNKGYLVTQLKMQIKINKHQNDPNFLVDALWS